jgi:hypothetical protein
LFSIKSMTAFGRWTKEGFNVSSISDSISDFEFLSERDAESDSSP